MAIQTELAKDGANIAFEGWAGEAAAVSAENVTCRKTITFMTANAYIQLGRERIRALCMAGPASSGREGSSIG